MCLAVPGKIIECSGEEAVVDLHGNRLRISTVLTPEAAVGDWVLAHAGFAISLIEEEQALETWRWLRTMSQDAPPEVDGTPLPTPPE